MPILRGGSYTAIYSVGRKCKISKTVKMKIIRDVNDNPQISAKMIVSELASSGPDVSRKPVMRALHRGGIRGHHTRKMVLITQML